MPHLSTQLQVRTSTCRIIIDRARANGRRASARTLPDNPESVAGAVARRSPRIRSVNNVGGNVNSEKDFVSICVLYIFIKPRPFWSHPYPLCEQTIAAIITDDLLIRETRPHPSSPESLMMALLDVRSRPPLVRLTWQYRVELCQQHGAQRN